MKRCRTESRIEELLKRSELLYLKAQKFIRPKKQDVVLQAALAELNCETTVAVNKQIA